MEMNMKASKANAIINANLNGVFMTNMIAKKGWSKLEARSYVVDFVTGGTKLSFKDFIESK